jgi:hypothetical protein
MSQNRLVQVLVLAGSSHLDDTRLRNFGISIITHLNWHSVSVNGLDPAAFDYVLLDAVDARVDQASNLPQELRERTLVIGAGQADQELYWGLGYRHFTRDTTRWLLQQLGVKKEVRVAGADRNQS